MEKIKIVVAIGCVFLILLMSGCSKSNQPVPDQSGQSPQEGSGSETVMALSSKIIEIETDFSAVEFVGDDDFENFLAQGGASSDEEVVQFLSSRLLSEFNVSSKPFGCSTIAAQSNDGDQLFGRNFDWQNCEALVISSKPEIGYASISTVNMNFIQQGGGIINAALEFDEIRTLAALYAPLDGLNEMGLAVAVNMIEDASRIEQTTDKPDITTTTAIRLLLNKAASVDEAVELLSSYDLHASMGMMVHFALADTSGKSIVVEYINNDMVVTETPVVTNFYLSPGKKYGIGSQQSKQRYDLLMQTLLDNDTLTMEGLRDALDRVSKDNFDEFASTEWSIAYNLNTGEAHYYHRENYNNRYTFKVK